MNASELTAYHSGYSAGLIAAGIVEGVKQYGAGTPTFKAWLQGYREGYAS